MSDQVATIAKAFDLDATDIVTDNTKLFDKIFEFEFSEKPHGGLKIGGHPQGDFWIDPVPSLEAPLVITLTLSLLDSPDTTIADPIAFSIEITETDCSINSTPDPKCFDLFGNPEPCP